MTPGLDLTLLFSRGSLSDVVQLWAHAQSSRTMLSLIQSSSAIRHARWAKAGRDQLMLGLARKLVDAQRERTNRARVTSVGEGSRLPGLIDRRAASARIAIGRNCLIQGQLVVERNESRIEIADDVLVGGSTVIDCALAITVERKVLISYSCIIVDSDNHSIYPELRTDDLANWMDNQRHDWTHSEMAPVRICEGAWIGARSIIL